MSLTAEDVERLIREGVPETIGRGLKIESVQGGRARARYPFNPRSIRPGGAISGPTIMGLADAAMYAAILSKLGRFEMAVTSQLNINFLNKATHTDLIADAEILRMSKRTAFMEVRIYSEGSDDMTAFATGSYVLVNWEDTANPTFKQE